jgi:hypothetical protein
VDKQASYNRNDETMDERKKILTKKNKNMLDGQAESGVCCQCKKTESRMRQK